jgi:glutamyl-tRNA synthetase
MSKSVRVRFPPSPTGYLHVGNIRSALFNYLFARHAKGTFILRIEDTDRERLVSDAITHIFDSLSWLGLTPDEGPGLPATASGPYIQSERLKLYHQYADELLKKGELYKDFTSSERLTELRQEAQAKKQPFRFTKSMAQLEPVGDEPYVLRFHIKPGEDVIWQDAVWGEQHWQRAVLDDFVALKSDGWPTYHFANVVDDHLMSISHVIRAAEWIPSTPKHILLYEAFGWEPPTFAHLPTVLGPDKAKLSKRHGAKNVLEYRDAGYLPEALVNYLASLGFNDGTTKEIYTEAELIKAFTLDRVQSSPAVFDAERLDWINGLYIRQLSLNELYKRCEGFWPPSAAKQDAIYKKRVLALVQERLKYLAELPALTNFFFTDPVIDTKLLPKQLEAATTRKIISDLIATLQESDFSEADLEKRLRGYVEEQDLKIGQVFGLIRVVITGQTAAPGLFETLHVLGKQASLWRLQAITHIL